jgi:small GTP-binding protein
MIYVIKHQIFITHIMGNCNNVGDGKHSNNTNNPNRLNGQNGRQRIKIIPNKSDKINMSIYDPNIPEKILKIVMAGNSSVGKTCFVTRIARNEFNMETKSTIGVDFCTKTVVTKMSSTQTVTSKIQIWDTAGQDRYRAISSSYYRNAHGVIAMFSIDDIASFEGLERWINEVQINAPDVVLIVVGTKADLDYKRKVPRARAEEYTKSCGAMYFEVSAMEGKGCEEVINIMVKQMIINNKNVKNNN